MSTYEDDYIQLVRDSGMVYQFRLVDHGMSWPPHDALTVDGVRFVQVALCTLSDREKEESGKSRGAMYKETDSVPVYNGICLTLQ